MPGKQNQLSLISLVSGRLRVAGQRMGKKENGIKKTKEGATHERHTLTSLPRHSISGPFTLSAILSSPVITASWVIGTSKRSPSHFCPLWQAVVVPFESG